MTLAKFHCINCPNRAWFWIPWPTLVLIPDLVQTHSDGRRTPPLSSPDAQAVSRYAESEVNIHYRAPIRAEVREPIPEEEMKRRQEEQMRQFYQNIEQRKEEQMREDRLARMHHDTLL